MKNFPVFGAVRRAGCAAGVALIVAGAGPVPGAPYPLRTETWLEVRARPFLKVGDATAELATIRMDLGPAATASGSLDLPPDRPVSAPKEVAIRVDGSPSSGEGPHRIRMRASFRRDDGARATSERALDLRDGATGFFEAGHGPGWRLTLAVTAERVDRLVARPPSALGGPVVFRVEVGRVVDGSFFPLETNDLSTFRGQPVEYAFRLGAGESLERLRLVLTPRRVEDDVVEIGLELTGELHAGRDRPLALDRRDTLFTDRGTTTDVSAVDGEPANGFRFRLTPRW